MIESSYKNKKAPIQCFVLRAYELWYQRSLLKTNIPRADQNVDGFLMLETPLSKNQLALAREARLLSIRMAGSRAGIGSSSWTQAEASERSGSIQIRTLEKLAEAVDCELIYCIRPKERKLFSNLIWEKLFAPFEDHKYRPWENGNQSKAFKLAGLVHWKWNDPKFRRSQGWMRKPAWRKNQFPATRDKSGRK